jgi:hypothetical protein
MVLDRRVGGGEEHALVAIAPPDEIRWRPLLAMHLDDHGFAVLITYVMSPDHQLIANFCSHHSSFHYKIIILRPARGTQGLKTYDAQAGRRLTVAARDRQARGG